MSYFGLSKRIEEAPDKRPDLFDFDVIPYIDPQRFNKQKYSLNEKSDVYSVGVIMWEISSEKQPFYVGESYDVALATQILQGRRESIIPNTPTDYARLYTGKYNI